MKINRIMIIGVTLVVVTVLSTATLMVSGTANTAVVDTPKPVTPIVPDVARPLPLSDVRLTGGPLKVAEDKDAEYLLTLEPDRMMAYFRQRAGLQPKALGYGGWD